LSSTLTESVKQLFRPQQPLWSCEFTTQHLIVAGVNAKRNQIRGKSAAPMPDGASVQASETLLPFLRESLRAASFRGSEIALVIPDEAARIAFVTTETLPKTREEQHTFLRWKLKKAVPFDVDTAQVAFRVVRALKPSGYDILVALSPRSVIQQYETLMEKLDIHAGFVVPSTLAALNLLEVPADDTLFVKIAPDCVTTTIFQNRHVTFYRRIAELGLYESVFPTVLYYQDKLGGTVFKQIVVCGYNEATRGSITELQDRLGIPAYPLQPRDLDDIYKPALGAVHVSWANLI